MATSSSNDIANNDAVHQRIAELERENTQLHERIRELEGNEQRFVSFMEHLPGAAFINSSTQRLTYANDWYFRQFNWNPADVLNRCFEELLPPEMVAYFAQQDSDVLNSNTAKVYEDALETPEGTRYYLTTKFPIPKPDATADIGGFTLEITERKHADAEREALQQQVIAAQRATLRELSTPLIPISDTVVIMPLIGTIDSQRAQQIMEALLDGVARQQATLAILDITGVQMVDTQVADALIRAAQAVKLLGAQVMLTGIQPQIAQTLVQLGVDLTSIQTRGSLQAGIAAALS